MATHRWLGLSFVIAIAAAFSACSTSSQTTTTTTTSSSSSSGAGGAGIGGAGAGGVSSTSSAGGGMVDAGPIVCSSPAAYSTIPEGSCNILQQDCPGGKTCAPVMVGSDFTTACVGNTGLKTAGEVCFSNTECDAKLFCVASKCTPVCCRDNDEPCNGGICNINVGFGAYNIFTCHYAPKCVLLTADPCPPGLDCHIEDATQGLATCGEPDGTTVPDLAPCKYLNDCATMEQCFQGDNLCHYYCDTAGSTQPPGLGGCPNGQACKAKYQGGDLGLGVSGIGLCFSTGNPPPPVDAGSDAGQGGAGPVDAGAD